MRRQEIFFTLITEVFCLSPVVYAHSPQLPTAGTMAVVNSDTVKLYQDMDSRSEVVGSLAKGTEVSVDLRIDQGTQRWCKVRVAEQAARLGFVDCRSLLRVGGPSPAEAARGSTSVANRAHNAAGEVPLAKPEAPTHGEYAAIRAEVVKEGVIDSGYLAGLDAQASSGNPAAVTRAALGHFAAADFEMKERNLDSAIEHYQITEKLAGRQRELLLFSLLGRGYALLLQSEYTAALGPIERARKLDPKSAQAAALAGWAHYRLNQTDMAVAELEASRQLHPSESVARLLDEVRRDREAEGDFHEGQSSHFVLRYHGGASRQLASEVMRTLEEQFQSLRDDLHYTPAEQITVILYTQEAFRDVTRVPAWTGAVNDGRIRVPVQGVEIVSPQLVRSLKHELTHSFVYQKTAGRCPVWLQEGIAQWMEGRRSASDARALVATYDDGKVKSLANLEGSWMQLSGPQVRFAYAWSLATVEAIEVQAGPDAIGRLLDAVRTEPTGDAALLEGLRTNFSSLNDATADYLRRTYAH